MNDIKELKCTIEGNGIYINDIMCVFKADNPASKLDSGQRKNEHYLYGKLQKICPCPYQTYF